MDFTLNGQTYALTPLKVEEALRGLKPDTGSIHFVEVNGVEYPIKQAFAKAVGVSRLDFNTQQARAIFRRLGFKVLER